VDLHVAVKELKVLCLHRELANAETSKDQSDDSAIHTASLMLSKLC
jgi:hypothetical protein